MKQTKAFRYFGEYRICSAGSLKARLHATACLTRRFLDNPVAPNHGGDSGMMLPLPQDVLQPHGRSSC